MLKIYRLVKTSLWRMGVCLFMLAVIGAGMAAVAAIDAGHAGDQPAGPQAEERETDGIIRQRRQMVEEQIRVRGVTDEAVLQAMADVPRHEFVPESLRGRAYADMPLPIGHGQTISQPYIVAYMTEESGAGAGDRVLEVGTGSGYQAAVLAEMGAEVYSVEIIPELAETAAARLDKLSYADVRTRQGDGYYGWEEAAPFDAIVVTAAAEFIPPPLIRQLKEDGRMIIPVGSPFHVQHLMLVEKEGGQVITRKLMPVRFVPFRRKR